MRVGILALLQESNTFISGKTTLEHFQQDVLLTGEEIRKYFADSPHEISGFFQGLKKAGIEAVPLFAARAYPNGVIEADTFDQLLEQMMQELKQAGTLDGILAAPHGATVAENHPDADGYWLGKVREFIGPDKPFIATLDLHANLSPAMVEATDALLAYRSNPHLDQLETGLRAADLMARTLSGSTYPTQAAAFPSLAINIQNQNTSQYPMSSFYDQISAASNGPDVISHSILLGFPYADVAEMGSSAVIVTDDQPEQAQEMAWAIERKFLAEKDEFEPPFISVEMAIAKITSKTETRFTLLDMGDNVGGGSPADSTFLLHALNENNIADSFICIFDPQAVKTASSVTIGDSVDLSIGAHTDEQHGTPLNCTAEVLSLHEGKFSESQARHGGFTDFDQGPTAIVKCSSGITIMLTSKRIPPFSLAQLTSCELDPGDFRIFVAKGVIAPQAAYQEVCDHFIQVNTPGATCADMKQLDFKNRRRPMFPFEE
ncbi:MAG: M81 family metallopeptidase [Verrucomicrobia bacterium]|nr:M81 family metallopeptidase [Verrucomicrobiota bacterium]